MVDNIKTIGIGDRKFNIFSVPDTDPFSSSIANGYGGELFRFAKPQLDRDSVVLDIGANIGLTACILSQLAGKVHAFEPQPDVYALLKRNVDSNAMTNTHAWNLAVSSAPGVAHFSGNSAYGFISNDANAPVVSVTTVDEFARTQGLDRVDFIKIDVEGFEPGVIEGGKHTIERFNPIIYMELNSWALLSHGRANPRDFLDKLFADFAEIYVVDQDGFTRATSALKVLHDNIVRGGSVDDLILLKRPRPLLPAAKAGVAKVAASLATAIARDVRSTPPTLLNRAYASARHRLSATLGKLAR